MANETEFTIEEQIEFINTEISTAVEYVAIVRNSPEEYKTAMKQLDLLRAVHSSLLKLDLLNKMEAENIEPIVIGDNP